MIGIAITGAAFSIDVSSIYLIVYCNPERLFFGTNKELYFYNPNPIKVQSATTQLN